MTLITFQDGTVVLRDGKVGTEQACCCDEGEGCCSVSSPDTSAQPDVTVTDGGCPCESGSHDGAYAFSSSFGDTSQRSWFWSGYSNCETDIYGFPFFADFAIQVECVNGGDWAVSAGTYAFPGDTVYSIAGSTMTCNLTVNGSGQLVGTVDIDMYGDSDSDGNLELICTVTLSFGP